MPLLSRGQVNPQIKPVPKKIKPVSQPIISDTIPKNKQSTWPVKKLNQPMITTNPVLNKKQLAAYALTNPSNLFLVTRHLTSDPEADPPIWATQYTDDEIIYDVDKRNQPNWEYEFIWTNIPATATQARFEISSQPFPPGETNVANIKESRIIRKLTVRTIGKKQADTVHFQISYKESAIQLFSKLLTNARTNQEDKQADLKLKSQDRSAAKQMNSSGRVEIPNSINPSYIHTASSTPLLSEQASYGYYFVRLIALDAAGNPVGRIGNSIKIVPRFSEWKEPVPTSEDSLQSDYEITAIHYVQMHEPEQQFENCLVITGYDPSNIFMNESFIGSVQCPSPPDEPSAFEKITGPISDVADFMVNVTTTIMNGASIVYNETKDFLKTQFGNLICNYNPAVSTLKETGLNKEDVDASCQVAAGIAFESALTYAGMPSSIPNFDEMCKLAKGEVVELMIQKAAAESGMPCDEICKQGILKAYDDIVSKSAAKNVVTQNGVSFKPDPRGQYQMPYVEIEITRTRQTQKGEPIITSLNFFTQVEKYFKNLYDKDNNKNYAVRIKTDKLYQEVTLPIPYLKNVGDKIKLVAMLTPKRSYFSYVCPHGAILGIENYQQACGGFTEMESEMVDPRFSSGYSNMLEDATITIKPYGKIALAPGVQATFVHYRK